jgi:hypothetical protein
VSTDSFFPGKIDVKHQMTKREKIGKGKGKGNRKT